MDRCKCPKRILVHRMPAVGTATARKVELKDGNLAQFVIFHINNPSPPYYIRYYRSLKSFECYLCKSGEAFNAFKGNIRLTLTEQFPIQNIMCDKLDCNKVALTLEELVQISILYCFSNSFIEDFTAYIKELFDTVTVISE